MTTLRSVLRPVRVVAIALSVAGLAAAAWASSLAPAATGGAGATSVVTVDVRATRQVIQGFGTSIRVWSDPHVVEGVNDTPPLEAQRQVLDALYRRLGLTRARPVLDKGVQPTPGAPFNFAGRLVDDHVAYVKQALPYGLKVVFPGPVYLEDWMKPDDPGSYVNWAMAMLKHWRDQGYEPALYAPLNEPKIARNFPPQWMHDVVLQLGTRLREAGFATKLVVPDDENPRDAYDRAVAVLSDPAARKYVAAIAYHIYAGDTSDLVRMRDLAARYGLPVWMTEYSNRSYKDWRTSFDWAVRMHTLLTAGGVSAIDYLWGFFGEWADTAALISLTYDGPTYKGFSYTPMYYVTGQYSRFVKPGYVRVSTSPAGGPVAVSAYKGNKRLVVVATNATDSATTVRIKVVRGTLAARPTGVRSSATDRFRSVTVQRWTKAGFTAVLTPQSVSTFVART